MGGLHSHGTDWETGFSLFWNLAALHGLCFQAVNDEVLLKANEAFLEVFYL